jgi:hypothetical protein
MDLTGVPRHATDLTRVRGEKVVKFTRDTCRPGPLRHRYCPDLASAQPAVCQWPQGWPAELTSRQNPLQRGRHAEVDVSLGDFIGLKARNRPGGAPVPAGPSPGSLVPAGLRGRLPISITAAVPSRAAALAAGTSRSIPVRRRAPRPPDPLIPAITAPASPSGCQTEGTGGASVRALSARLLSLGSGRPASS